MENGKVFEDWYINKKIIDCLVSPFPFEEYIHANEIFFHNLNSFQNANSIINYFSRNLFR